MLALLGERGADRDHRFPSTMGGNLRAPDMREVLGDFWPFMCAWFAFAMSATP
jgi:hypothetical protein